MSACLPKGLRSGTAQDAGLNEQRLGAALSVLEEAIAKGEIPGAVVAVVRDGTLAVHKALGSAQVNPEPRPMLLDTPFDVASLTKVMATLPSVLHLMEQGAFRLDDRLVRFFPSFTGGGKEEVKIRHLLTHTAGLQPWLPLEQEEGTRPERIERILTAPLQEQPGTKVIYTDLGFILLAELVEHLSGKRIDQYAAEHIFGPLGLKTACYNPSPELAPTCAATEYRDYLGRHQCGEVHDERATCLGGVAGHAGLFATALEVAAYGNLWQQGGLGILSPATIQAATRVLTPANTDGRGLGWIVLRPGDEFMSCGDLFTPGSFGHTGFTGTSLWVDPQRKLTVALLTNRVHFGRQDHILRLRPRFHNAVAASVC